MFLINNDTINEEFEKTSWERDFEHYSRTVDNFQKNSETVLKNDVDRANNFYHTMTTAHCVASKNSNLRSYYAIREKMVTSKLTPEELDYGMFGNTCIGTTPQFETVNFDNISTMGYIPRITKIVSNEPNTVVYFNDNTKIVVRCEPDEPFDAEKGIYIAILKKAIGPKNLRHLFNIMSDMTRVKNVESVSDIFDPVADALCETRSDLIETVDCTEVPEPDYFSE